MAHGDAREGKWRGKMRMEWVASRLASTLHTPRLPVVDWIDPPADWNGLVRFAERPILVSARVPSRFALALPRTTRLTRTGKSRAHGSIWGLAEVNVGFVSLQVVSWSQRHCMSVLQAGSRVHKSHKSAFIRSLSNSISRHKSNVLILRNVAWYSLAVAGACYVLYRNDIVTANVKFPPGQHTNIGVLISP